MDPAEICIDNVIRCYLYISNFDYILQTVNYIVMK